MKRTVSVLCAASVAALSVAAPVATAEKLPGKSKSAINKYLADKPAPLREHFARIPTEGERNAVLNFMRTGLAALELGDDALAARNFDEALLRIETVYANNPKAQKARSKFVKESKKDFKGEPYERAMAYYYRGLIYMREGDYENARASFRGGQLQDAFAEDTTYASDIALFDVLSGWSSQCLGDQSQAEEFYSRAREARPNTAIPKMEDRILLLADLGPGPHKTSDGQYLENLRFRQETHFPERSIVYSTPDIAASVLGQVARVKGEAAQAEELARLANLKASAREARATAAEAEAELARMDAINAPDDAVFMPAAELPDTTGAAVEPDAAFGPQEAGGGEPPSTPQAFASELGAIVGAASAQAGEPQTEISADALAADALAQPRISRKQQLTLLAEAAYDEAVIQREEATQARTEANATDAALQARRDALNTTLRYAASIGLLEQARSTPAITPMSAYDATVSDDTLVLDQHGANAADALQPISARLGESVFWQASTRGGRPIDGILAGKAEFKANTAAMSESMAEAGLIFAQSANTMLQQQLSMQAQGFQIDSSGAEIAAGIGVGLMLFSAVSGAMSSAAKPQADIRYWDNLPAQVDVAFAPSENAFSAHALDEQGNMLRTMPVTVKMDPYGRCGVAWIRTHSALQIPVVAPNSDPKR